MSHNSSEMLKYPAADRNKGPIAKALAKYIDSEPKTFLEISSGSGQHIAHFAAIFPNVQFQPSENNRELFRSISAYASLHDNVLEPVHIDVSQPLRIAPVDFIYNANMMHIAPFACTEGLFDNAGRNLKSNGLMFTYGPFARNGVIRPQSNVDFDRSLRGSDSSWGLRDTAVLEELAARNGLGLEELLEMPANNLMLIWRKIK